MYPLPNQTVPGFESDNSHPEDRQGSLCNVNVVQILGREGGTSIFENKIKKFLTNFGYIKEPIAN